MATNAMVTMHHYSTQEGHFQHYWFTKVQTNQEIEFPSRHPGFNIQTKLFPVRKISFCYIIYFVTCGWRFYGDKMWLAKVKQHSFPTRTVMIFVKSFTPADRSCLCFATELVLVQCWVQFSQPSRIVMPLVRSEKLPFSRKVAAQTKLGQ